MSKVLLLVGAAICFSGAPAFAATGTGQNSTHHVALHASRIVIAKAACILPGTTDSSGNLISPGGPCQGNNGYGNGTEPSCTLACTGNVCTTVCNGPDIPPGNSAGHGSNKETGTR
jgi:hypothetical protein